MDSNASSWQEALEGLRLHTATWQRRAIRHLQQIKTFKDFLKSLKDEDANTRIVTAEALGDLREVLTPDQRDAAIDALLPLLGDRACNEYEYGSWQADEVSAVFVSATAEDALRRLGYATDPKSVFHQAQSQGAKRNEAKKRD